MPASIRTRRAFDSLSASRARGRSGPLWVAWARIEDPPTCAPAAGIRASNDRVEVAFSIGRGVGSAVPRNRLRRRLRVLMDERIGVGLAPGRYLIGVRPGVLELTFGQLRERLGLALEDLA